MSESKEPAENGVVQAEETLGADREEVQAVPDDSLATQPAESEKTARDAHDDELAQLRRRVQEQDQRWEHATKLLSDIAQRQTQESTKPTRTNQYQTPALIALVAVVAIGAGGLWYFRSAKSQPSTAAPTVASHDTSPAAASAPPVIATTQHRDIPSAQAQVPAAQVVPSVPSASAPQQEASKSPALSQSPPPVPESATASAPEAPQAPPRPKAVEATLNDDLSKQLSDYLHSHKLPYVDALVFATPGGTAKSVELSGQVRGLLGKEHAVVYAKAFFPAHVSVKNRIEINAALAARSSAPDTPAPGVPIATSNSCQVSCQTDQDSCATKCKTDAAGNAGGMIGQGLTQLFGQAAQAAAALKQCTDGCEQALNQCVTGCGQSAASEAQAPPTDAAPAPDNAASSAEGPDNPPE